MNATSTARLVTTGCLALLAACVTVPPAEQRFAPVYAHNFPDPFVMAHEDEYLAYGTNYGLNLPMLRSGDLVHWAPVTGPDGKPLDGMPELASWVKEGFTWAPEVMEIGGRWLLYYTANHAQRDVQCIGVAIAARPTGPFVDRSGKPMVCQYDLGGTIDADPFRDPDGKLYLYYKSDGNRVGQHTVIWGQRLSDDGLSVVGPASPLVEDDQAWEWKLVEAPAMVRAPGGYRLFYSAAYYGWAPDERLSRYATGYATCEGPLGPCSDAPENPILHSVHDETGCISGPGHPSVFEAKGRSYIAFHAWAATAACRPAKEERFLYIAPLSWEDGKPRIGATLRP